MDVRSPLNQCIALALAGILFLNPIVTVAAELAVDQAAGGNTQLGQAGNGVPVVNIASPNGSGLSHNKFSEYNVGQQGLILNNATSKTQATQLGGLIIGNPNLKGQAASTILNEVTGGNRSHLGGYTEVAGQSARVIVANPHGLTCNGCGFINIPRASMTTGKPIIESGRLERFQVDGGDIAIEGAGLNAGNVEQFDLITRSAKLNAELHAQQLNVITGRNDVQADSLVATPRAGGVADKPQLAIDSSVLGGMYAGAIRLVGTEAGVGVKLAGNMAASAGDIQIDANGQLTLAQTAASGDLRVNAQSAELTDKAYAGGNASVQTRGALTNHQSLATGGALQLSSGGQLTNAGIVEAGVNPDHSRNPHGDIQVTARDLRNSGSLVASRNLQATASGTLDNRGGTLSAQGQAKVSADKLDNSQKGRVLAKGSVDLAAGQLQNGQGGVVNSSGNLDARVGQLDNRGGEVSSQGLATLTVDGLDNRGGRIIGEQAIELAASGSVNNQGGTLGANQQVKIKAGTLDNSQQGRISSQGGLDLTVAGTLHNQAGGQIGARGNASVSTGALDNGQGLLTSSGDLQLGVAGALINLGGELSSSGATRIDAASLDNRAGDILGDTGLAVDVVGAVANQGGTLGSGGALELNAGSLDNSQQGSVVSDGSLTLRVSDRLDNQAQGTIAAKGDIDVRVGSLDNRGGRVSGQRSVAVSGQQIDNRAGAIQSAAGLSLDTQALDNSRQGLVSSKGGMDLDLDQLDNQAGLISAAGPLALKARDVQNAQGRIASQNSLSAKVGNLNQQGGELVALGKLGLTADTLDNRRGGLVGATDALDLKVGELDNRGGEISSQAGITLAGQGLDNSDGGKILAGEAFRLTVERILNHAKGLIFGHGGSRINANHLDNSGGTLASQQALAIALSDRSAHDPRLDGALTNQQGLISSEGTLTVDVSQLGNQAGTLSSAGDLKVSSTGLLDNRAGAIVTDAALVLTSNRLDNSLQGRLSAKGNAQVSTGDLDNSQGGSLTSAGDLELKAERVSNSGKGRIASGGDLNAVVASLNQQDGGELFSKASLSLDLQQGLLDNSNGGLINAPGQLLLKNLGMVFNQGGEISSQQGFTLVAHQLDNNGGKLLSNQPLVLRIAQALDNVKGSISAARLQVDAGHLDNSGGRVSSTGNFDLKVAGLLNNQDGELVALDRLDLEAASLDNRQNGLVGAVKGLSLAVDDLDNRGGEISSRAGATLSGQRLDNSGGKLLADGSLALAIDQVINQAKGLVSGKAGLSLSGAQLTNDGGTLSSLQGVTLNLSERFSNQWGLVNSEGALGIQAGTLDNSHGVLSSAGPLSLESLGALTNRGGQVLTDGSLDLRSASLDNRQGLFSAQGAMEVQTGTLDNRQGGRLIGGDTFSLIAGEVDNSAQGRIGSAKALDARVTGLDQHDGGQLFSQADLSLDLQGGDLDNGNGGLINAPGQLLLNNLGHVANQGGEISSQQAFTLAARSLDNSRGKLLSAQALTLRIEQALSNLKGLIAGASLDARAARLDNGGGTLSSRGDLDLRAQALLNGQQGLINAAQALRLTGSNLDNRGGSLLAGTSLDVTADSLDNSDLGLINSQGRLTLASTQQLTNNNGGEISAKGELALSTGQFTQRQGRLIGESGLTLDLNGGDLDNQGGLILARGPLRLEHLRDLTNQGGEISSVQGFALNLRHLDNRGGKLISNDQLGLTVATANNQGGLLSGWQGLQLTGQSLDNSARGTLSSRSGDVTVKLQGALQNSGEGALVSQGKLDVQAASLDNHDKGILSSGGAQKLAVTGLLDNRNGGLVDSASDLDLSAATLANAGGRLAAEGNLNLTATATDLDNSAGSIATNGSATLSLLGVLTNTGGTLASRGPLTLQRAAQVNNQGGQIASQGLLTLLTGGLDNRNGGTLAANGALLLSASGAVQNSGDGLIYSRDAAVTLSAASLDNDGGTLQSQGDLKLTATGAVSNLGGQLISRAGNVDLSGNTLDNRGGTLASLQGWVKARLDGWLNNGTLSGKGGILQAQSLDLAAASLDNRGGHVSALSGAALLNVGHVDNGQGGLFAKQALKVTGTSLANGGQIAGGRVDFSLAGALDNQNGLIESASTLALAAATLDNRSGQLRALGTSGRTELNVQGLFDNRGGVLESANTEFGLVAASFLNTSGKVLHVGSGAFDVAMAHVTNAGGSLVTRGALTLTADSWTNSSVLQAGSLTVNVGQFTQTASGQLLASNAFTGRGGNWANDGLIASDGVFSLNLSGTYSGNGRLSSLGDLGLTANQLLLPTAGRITGGGTTTLNIDGPLTNHGRITSASDLTVNSGALSNFGTLGSASQLRLVTPTLLNENGLIFSGADMALRVGSFTNRYADVYSLGALDIAANDAGTRSAALENISATLESAGDMHLAAASIVNRKDFFSVSEQLQSGTIKFQCIGCYNNKYSSAYYYVDERIERTVTADSAASVITSGGNLGVISESFHNQHSLVSAAGDIKIDSSSFLNEGASTESVVRSRTFLSPREGPEVFSEFVHGGLATYNKYNSLYVHQYGFKQRPTENNGQIYSYYGPDKQITDQANPDFNPTAHYGVPDRILGYTLVNSSETSTNSGVAANAIIQAGGNVSIQASSSLGNGVSRSNVAYAGGTNRVSNTAVNANTGGTVQINSQLPPDLAQQQVNPLALPGFNLPSGENGLFRLSGQGGSAAEANTTDGGPQQWTMGGASIGLAQREQQLPNTQAREVQVNGSGQTSTGQLGLGDRQLVTGASASQVQVQVGGPAEMGNLPGRTQVEGGMSQGPGVAPQPGDKPTSAGHLTVDRVQGLPGNQVPPKPHKYLVETNPELTNLKQFLSSDYLLGQLGYDPDRAQKRLGDGLYEQRLVREAIANRTGQRFLAGLNSDEAMFRQLMDNAIASKQQLALSVGVSLSPAQVAALTHDIVWMEEHVVNGEKVLVPVLYLAQANNRLAPNGALIQGQDVTLIAGGELNNQGTLRASNNLSASGQNLNNAGLIEAGDRVSLLATDSIRNAHGGLIAGRDVSAIALTGDLVNERTVTEQRGSGGGFSWQTSVADNAARIEAANDLSLSAGRDLANRGGVLSAGGNASLSAGRDLTLGAATEVDHREGQGKRWQVSETTVTQHGSKVKVGGDLKVEAGRDLAVVASNVAAERDLAMTAGRDLSIESAANESHSSFQSKKVTSTSDQIRQQSSTVQAGGDLALKAGQDLTVLGSRVRGDQDVHLDAQRDHNVLSAKDESASYYVKKSKGSLGRSKSEQRESYDSTNVASAVEAGRDLTLNSSKSSDGRLNLDGGRDVTIIGSQLKAGEDLLVGATGDIAVLSGVEEHGSYSKKAKSGSLGASKSSKSQFKTTATQVASELGAGNDMVIAAGNDIRLRASEAEAGNDIELRAGLVSGTGDINLVSANDTAYSRAEQHKKKAGLSTSGGFVSVASAKKAGQEAQTSTSVGSQVAADRDAILQAERDINVIGSGISAGRNVSLDAGRDVNVVAAGNSSSQHNWEKNKQVGVSVSGDDNGVSLFAGGERTLEKDRHERNTAATSQISAGHDLGIKAKRDINQTGSDLGAVHDINLQAGRDINIDVAHESQLSEREHVVEHQGVGVTVDHNFGSTRDTASNTGKGDNNLSKGSSILQSIDGISHFLSGPTADVRVGYSKQGSQQQVEEQTNRGSTLNAGNDLNISALNDVTVSGSKLSSGRDINVKGRDVTLDIAQGALSEESTQKENWSGVHGGTSGGLKLGMGGSHGVSNQDGRHGTSTATRLDAGRDINLNASNDLNLIGTQAKAGHDIDLEAGNDLNIRSAQNESTNHRDRHSGGGEVGLAIGSEGVGGYTSVSQGKGHLDREGERQQEAYLYAGDQLKFTSGRDTAIAGAELRGDDVIGRVGGDLTIASVADTGKAKGKEFDLNATVTVGPGSGLSGSVGVGKTNGDTHWIDTQTSITAKDRLDIRTERHTQLDGALLASDNGNLTLDTGSLGFTDIAGHDKEHSYYVNAGGTTSIGGSTAQQDASQVGKGTQGQNGWSLSGYEYQKDREQIVHATVGKGEIIVRNDAHTGQDSTASLNRDVDKAYEITKDKEERTDLYASQSSLEAAAKPAATLQEWGDSLAHYDDKTKANFEQASNALNAGFNRLERVFGRDLPAGAEAAGGKALAEGTLEALLLSGMGRSEALSLMGDASFQQQFLAELNAIQNVSLQQVQAVQRGLEEAGVFQGGQLVLAPVRIDGGLTGQQEVLRSVSAINTYLQEHPEQGQAVGLALAMAQGPKGIITLAAEQALLETEIGKKLQSNLAILEEQLGKAIADGIEHADLDRSEAHDQHLLGGGELIGSILIGSVGGGKGGKGKTQISVSNNSSSAGHGGKGGASVEGAKGSAEAASLASGARLRGQLAGQEISGGHAFEKHVIQQGEFKSLGITTREQFASHIESVVNSPSSFRKLSGGRTAYWDDVSGTVVIRNPKAIDGGTAFRPTNGKAYFEGLR